MEAHIKGHANDMPDDDNVDNEMMRDRSPSMNGAQHETKHSILLSTPSTSSNSTTPSPNTLAVTKYESNEGSNLMNFAEQFTIMNSSSSSTAPSSSAYPDTPKDSEASSEQNSDGDDVTYINMYSRFEQNVVNQYGMNAGGVNPALLAAAASATLQPITPTSNNSNSSSPPSLITLKPIQHQQSSSSYDLSSRNNGSVYFNGANIPQQNNDYK